MLSSRSRLTLDDVAASDAGELLKSLDRASTITLGHVTVQMSDQFREVLTKLLKDLADGKAVEVSTVTETLTTQEAADLLRVSRPTLVKMLTDGLLPYEQPGVHRRVPREALEAFLASRGQRRAKALDALSQTVDSGEPDEIVTTR